jgi:predicted small secreted protein
MKAISILFVSGIIAASMTLSGCSTATGTGVLVGAGIGSLSGDAGKGALIGGATGLVIDSFD